MSCLQDKTVPPPAFIYLGQGFMFVQGRWTGCRESFHSRFKEKGNKHFYYNTGDIRAVPSVANLIDFAESILRIKKKYRTEIYQCESKSRPVQAAKIICIKYSPFWASTMLRFRFFSALTKTGKVNFRSSYANPLDPLEQIMDSTYFKKTSQATAMFLCGWTFDKIPTISGWVTVFRADVRQDHMVLMAQPRGKTRRVYFKREKATNGLTIDQKERLRQWVMLNDGVDISKKKLRNICPFKPQVKTC